MPGLEFRIPEEISTFLDDEYGKILLVKGAPGSGKTVFALTLLSMLGGNGIYLAARIDPETVYRQHPWIEGAISASNIVDAVQTAKIPKTKEIIIKPLKYTDVPDFLKAVYARTEKMEKPVVIIDSWDAVVSYTGYHAEREREELERSLYDFCRRTMTKILLLAENTEQTPLDYLADGVIVLESVMYEERRLRRITLQKLRGCEIKNPVHLFSLNNGIFKSFNELSPSLLSLPHRHISHTPIADLSDSRISTGIEDLDRVIGGYGTFNLFEGEYITYELIACALSLNALSLGRKLIFMPWQEMIERLMPLVEPKYHGNMEVVEDINELEDRMKVTTGGERRVIFINLSEIEDEGVVRGVIRGVMAGRENHNLDDVVICFMSTDDERRRVDYPVTTYIRTMFISGVPCLYGVLPRTGIHALELYAGVGITSTDSTATTTISTSTSTTTEIRLTPVV